MRTRKIFAMLAAMLAMPSISIAQDAGGEIPVIQTPDTLCTADSGKISISIVLPFSGLDKSKLNNSIDFYFGALMAAKELGKKGTDIEIRALDYSLGEETVRQADSSDIVIGPFRSSYLFQCLDWLSPETTLISPLDRKANNLTGSDARLLQAATSGDCLWASAIDWNKEFSNLDNPNIIIITGRKDSLNLKNAISAATAAGLEYTVCTADVSHPIAGWREAYKQGADNCVLLITTNEAILNNAIRNLAIESRRLKFRVFTNNKVIQYETIPSEDFHKIDGKVVCPYYIDYADKATMEFVREYRAYFKLSPTQFAFHGHDLCYFVIKMMSEFGKDWKEKICEMPQLDLLESSFKIRKHPNGGLANFGVRKIEFSPDFNVLLRKKDEAASKDSSNVNAEK